MGTRWYHKGMRTTLALLGCPWSYSLLRLDRGVVETIAALNQVFQPLGEAGGRSTIDNCMIEAQRHAEIFANGYVPVYLTEPSQVSKKFPVISARIMASGRSRAACRSLLRAQPSSHQDTLDYLDEQEIDQYCSRKEEEVQAGQWHEFERHGQRGKRKNQAERHNREHRDCQRQTWATAEWVARGADDKQDQRLRCE